MLKKHLLTALMCGIAVLAANAATIPVKLVKTISANETGAAVDKNNKMLPVTIEYQGNNARFTIYDENLSTVKKQFILNDVYDGYDMEPECVYYSHIDMFYDLNVNMYLTQALFNDDDNWEVVIMTRVSDESAPEYGTTKYLVYNENGDILGEAPVYENYSELLEFIYQNGEFYLVDDSGDTINFYSCKPGAASVPSIELGQSAARAYPNPLPAGHSLTVELAAPADEATVVEVYDIAGRLITSAKATAGETKVAVHSRRLHNGNYVYTVKSNGQTIEEGKIIAK